MSPEEVCNVLTGELSEAIVETKLDTSHPHAVVEADRWHDVAELLRHDDRLAFDMLRCITGLDLLADNRLAAVYDLHALTPGARAGDAWTEGQTFAVRVEVDRDDPHIPSVADVWPTADWHEREAYDLFGIIFDGHPNLKRILCPEDWVGYPLRKDYVFPREYHGIPGTTEYELPSPVH